MEITPPVPADPPPDRVQVRLDLAAERHRILTAAERIAAAREYIRREGRGVERLERVEAHLVWVLGQLDAEVAALKAAGWEPPPAPYPDRRGLPGSGLPGT